MHDMTPEWQDAYLEWAAKVPTARGVEIEHEEVDAPQFTEQLVRVGSTVIGGEHNFTEHMWVQGYPQVRLIVVTVPAVILSPTTRMPGYVREVPVPYQEMASAELFGQRIGRIVATYIEQGWTVMEDQA